MPNQAARAMWMHTIRRHYCTCYHPFCAAADACNCGVLAVMDCKESSIPENSQQLRGNIEFMISHINVDSDPHYAAVLRLRVHLESLCPCSGSDRANSRGA